MDVAKLTQKASKLSLSDLLDLDREIDGLIEEKRRNQNNTHYHMKVDGREAEFAELLTERIREIDRLMEEYGLEYNEVIRIVEAIDPKLEELANQLAEIYARQENILPTSSQEIALYSLIRDKACKKSIKSVKTRAAEISDMSGKPRQHIEGAYLKWTALLNGMKNALLPATKREVTECVKKLDKVEVYMNRYDFESGAKEMKIIQQLRDRLKDITNRLI